MLSVFRRVVDAAGGGLTRLGGEGSSTVRHIPPGRRRLARPYAGVMYISIASTPLQTDML